jgi:hypothetical protein
VGYSIYGNYLEGNPPARIIDAVGSGEIDVAIIWGPFADVRRSLLLVPEVHRPPSR